MSCNDGNGGSQPGGLDAPRRNNYYYGKLLDVLHLQMEQAYGNDKRWLLNRLSLGTGVLCGLGVEAQQDGTLCVTPGVAIDGWGREIVVPIRMCLDPWGQTAECCQGQGPLPRDREQRVSLYLCYAECATDYVPVLVSDCNTRAPCAPGTIVETFRLLVRPVEHAPAPAPESPLCRALLGAAAETEEEPPAPRDALCQALSGPCAVPPRDPCVCLATVQLLPGGRIGEIDTCTCRPLVYSNAVLFEMILCLAARIEECCGKTPPPPLIRVARVSLMNGDQVIADLDPTQPPKQLVDVFLTAVEVEFDKEVNGATVAAGKSFLLERDGANVAGSIVPAGPKVVRYLLPPGGLPLKGNFRIVLRGTGTSPIMGAAGTPLDGEPAGLPSGDGTSGGDFTVRFTIASEELIKIAKATLFSANQLVGDLDPLTSKVFEAAKNANRIDVAFDANVDPATVVVGKNFLVQRDGADVAGEITAGGPRLTRFEAAKGGVFAPGIYRVSLLGSGPSPIKSIAGSILDGEPEGLPSGDGMPGGNFLVEFVLTAPPLIRVARVSLMNVDQVIADLDPAQPPKQLLDVLLTTVKVEFDKEVNHATVKAEASFLLTRDGTNIAGSIVPAGPKAVRYEIPAPATTVGTGSFRIVLRGTGTSPIMGTAGTPLDGEPVKLPSGDGIAGGDFQVDFRKG